MANEITLSDDHMRMVIRSGRYKAELRSARPHGFTEGDVEYARDRFTFTTGMRKGQVNQTWRREPFFFHVNTGPPWWWWWPHVRITRDTIMVGWLRALVAVKYAPRRTR